MQSRFFYFKDILKIAAPIIMGNLGFIMIGVGDVIVAGRHSTDTLAAVSLATAITNCIMMFGIGILVSVPAILSNYRGEKIQPEKYFFTSVKFAAILAFITFSVIMAGIPVVDILGFGEKLTPMVKDYFFITAFAAFGGYLHCVTKEFLQSFEIVIFPNILTIFSVFINIGLNIILVFGCGIIPSLGVVGLAIASLVTRYFMGIVLALYCLIKLPLIRTSIKPSYKEEISYTKDLLKVGFPVSLAIMIEFAGFNIISVVMGRVAGIYAAAHNILCTITSITFMVPLAISNATAIKVGYSNGAKEYYNLRKYAFSGIKMSVIFMAVAAIILGLSPEFLMSLFTNDAELIKICVPLIYILCLFQVFDGLQVSLSGIFKGIKNTKIVMISNFIAYWIIAFPLGCTLAFHFKLALMGFWISLWLAAIIICTIMFITMLKKLPKPTSN